MKIWRESLGSLFTNIRIMVGACKRETMQIWIGKETGSHLPFIQSLILSFNPCAWHQAMGCRDSSTQMEMVSVLTKMQSNGRHRLINKWVSFSVINAMLSELSLPPTYPNGLWGDLERPSSSIVLQRGDSAPHETFDVWRYFSLSYWGRGIAGM